MSRPCFLVVDREHTGSISTRKLVIETAKLNVITAYSGAEAIDTLERFPKLDGVVLDAHVDDLPCEEIIRQLRALQPGILIVLISPPYAARCEGADHLLEPFQPGKLLALLQKLVPEAQQIQEREQQSEDGADVPKASR